MKIKNYKIEGMTCSSCALSIEKTAKLMDGVKGVKINFASETGAFEVDEALDPITLKNKIGKLGYTLIDFDDPTRAKKDTQILKFSISFVLALCIFALSMGPIKNKLNSDLNHYLQLLLSLPIMFWTGWRFIKAIWTLLITRHSNMDTLIGLGIVSAFIYSFVITVFKNESIRWGLDIRVYYEAIGFIVSFVYLGQYFEHMAKKKANAELEILGKLGAKNARVIDVNGNESLIPMDKLEAGMTIKVLPGEKIPVDGKVTKGESTIDESVMTGEPLPVLKSSGDSILSGTINQDGVLFFRATKVGKETLLAQIMQHIQEAQMNRPPIQRIADRVSSIFVPAIILIAVTSAAVWFFFGPAPVWGNALSTLIAVMVIACPCALGLATPTAVVVATGLAARYGILINGGESIEVASKIGVLAFDKTGTLTEGKPKVGELVTLSSDYSKDEINLLAGSLSLYSDHPLSQAVRVYCEKETSQLLDPDEFKSVPGRGLIGKVKGQNLVLGSERFMQDLAMPLQSIQNAAAMPGSSAVMLAINNENEKKILGTFYIVDTIRQEAKNVIAGIHRAGIATWVLTGDRLEGATPVVKQLMVQNVKANLLPAQKVDAINEIKKLGKLVAMVGDGINDAPALASADLSLAMGSGTDIAKASADVTLLKGDLKKALEFIILGRISMRVIKQNLFLSFIYNGLCIPLAAGVFYPIWGLKFPPALAGLVMGISSICVVLNSLRIPQIFRKAIKNSIDLSPNR